MKQVGFAKPEKRKPRGSRSLEQSKQKIHDFAGSRVDSPSGSGDVFASTLLFIQLSAEVKSQRAPKAFKMVVERRATVDEYEAVVIAGVNHLALIDLPENAF